MSRRDPRSASPYLNFDLLIERQGDQYRIRVIGSPSGEEDDTFPAPFTESELEVLTGRLEGARGRMRRMNSPQLALAKEMGGRLYQTAMTPAIRRSLARAVDQAELQDAAGVRVRLRLDSAPELAVLPWELMYDPDPRVGRFVALAEETPLVRYLNLPERIRPLKVTPPVRVLVVVANPADDRYSELDVEAEWRRLQDEALKDSIDQGLISLTRVRRGTLSALQQELLEADYNVLHYVGHGRFDQQHQDGLLVFEGERGGVNEVSAERFGALLHNERQLGLAVINACEGGRAAATDPYAGMAQTLVRMGVPAVVAMQFEISDKAAITFARYFYWNIARGRPVDTAITHARMAVFQQVSEVEWATPVLYMRAPDGRIFDIEAIATPKAAPVAAAAVFAEVPAPASPRAAAVVSTPLPKPEPVKRPREPRRPSPLATGLRRAGALTIGIPAQTARGARRVLSSTASVAVRLPAAGAAAAMAAIRMAQSVPLQTARTALVGVVAIALIGMAALIASAWPRSDASILDPAIQDPGRLVVVPTLEPSAAPPTSAVEPTVSPTAVPESTPSPDLTVAPSAAPPATTAPPRAATPVPTPVATQVPPSATPIPPPTATSAPIVTTGTSTVRGSVMCGPSCTISGMFVQLRRVSDGASIATTTSDGVGVFRFANVPADAYSTSLTIPSGSAWVGYITPAPKAVTSGSEVDLGATQVMRRMSGLAPNGATLKPQFPLLWDAVSQATAYYVSIYAGTERSGTPIVKATVNGTQYMVTALPAGPYVWDVYAATGNPPWYLATGIATFTIP